MIRTRFAPSPTGFLHVGGLRTALYCYLFAKKNNGKFILRIEDTDQSRKVDGAMENLIDTLKWAGINFDEGPTVGGDFGPYIQSERLNIYHEHAQKLVDEDKAYFCFCSPERLDEVRKKQIELKIPPQYDRLCRELPKEIIEQKKSNGEKFVVRMKVPLIGETTFVDLIRGNVTIANKVLDDQVLLKSDGFPTYHLAVVVDDHFMKISHVIRGEEWLPSTPKHILLYKYFGWELPHFAHLPLLLNPDKSKLSKRQGDVAVEDYKAKGYLKEAIVNFISLLGWNPGDNREIFSLEELKNEFSLERVGKSGAIFNIEKLNWINQEHLRKKTDEEILELITPLYKLKNWDTSNSDYIKKVIALMKERVITLNDFTSFCDFFFVDPENYDEKGIAKNWTSETPNLLNQLASEFEQMSNFTYLEIEKVMRKIAENNQVSAAKLIHPLRLASSGLSLGPSLFHLVEVLGKETILRRIKKAIEKIK
ncbi:MAG: glutamate--tRNA ligase [Bacteroidota bacterium]